MNYIVLDLEWNQAMSAKSSVFNYLPIHLRGEIIQIGAVKLDENFYPCSEFQADVKPVWFRKMHHKVKKLTGFDDARLENGLPFAEAMQQFWDWAGPECTYMTWGYDDFGIMEQNLIIHDMEIDWMGEWINLQLIYNRQTEGDRNQKSLETAMEHFGIEQTRTAHDALGDAYNTGLVCSKLDLLGGLAQYSTLRQQLDKKVRVHTADDDMPDPIEHIVTDAFDSKEDLWSSPSVNALACPECGKMLDRSRWLNQGDRRYMSMAHCDEHGDYLIRVRLRHLDDERWCANRLVYKADESMQAFFKAKMKNPNRRRRHRKKTASA